MHMQVYLNAVTTAERVLEFWIEILWKSFCIPQNGLKKKNEYKICVILFIEVFVGKQNQNK